MTHSRFSWGFLVLISLFVSCEQPSSVDPFRPARTLSGTTWQMDFTQAYANGGQNYLPPGAKMLRTMSFVGNGSEGVIYAFEEVLGFLPTQSVLRSKTNPISMMSYLVAGDTTLVVNDPQGSTVVADITSADPNQMTVQVYEGGVKKPVGVMTRISSIPTVPTKSYEDCLSETTWALGTSSLITLHSKTSLTRDGVDYTLAQQTNNNGMDLVFDVLDSAKNPVGFLNISLFTLGWGEFPNTVTKYYKQ